MLEYKLVIEANVDLEAVWKEPLQRVKNIKGPSVSRPTPLAIDWGCAPRVSGAIFQGWLRAKDVQSQGFSGDEVGPKVYVNRVKVNLTR